MIDVVEEESKEVANGDLLRKMTSLTPPQVYRSLLRQFSASVSYLSLGLPKKAGDETSSS